MDWKAILTNMVPKGALGVFKTLHFMSCNIRLSLTYLYILIIWHQLSFKGWVKRKVLKVAGNLPQDAWNNFRIVRYEDRSVKGGRPY